MLSFYYTHPALNAPGYYRSPLRGFRLWLLGRGILLFKPNPA
jgi:hypothetical protein